MDHLKSHWSSCSVDLPDPLSRACLFNILDSLPKTILRVKGCTRLDQDSDYSYFEKTPHNDIPNIRPHSGLVATGPKLLSVGPGSNPEVLGQLIANAVLVQDKLNKKS